jgi:two-component system, NarL family, sensor kinase
VQTLAGVSYTLSALAEREENDAIAQQLSSTSAGLRDVIRELRSLAVTIAPRTLHEEGLAAALDDMSATIRARGVDADVRVEGEVDLSPTAEELLHRVALEAVRNSLAHANAGKIGMTLAGGPDRLVRLEIRDDGVGLSDDRLHQIDGDHLGLRLLADLVHEAGGTFEVHSAPQAGTAVTVQVQSR